MRELAYRKPDARRLVGNGAQSGAAGADGTDGDGATTASLIGLDQALEIIRHFVAEVEPDHVSGEQASVILDRFLKIDRAAAAGRLGFARRAAQCSAWHEDGHPSAADWLAQKAKTTVGEASSMLKAAGELPSLPATREALRMGSLSVVQVREIADAATADPAAETALIEAAGYLSIKGLQNRARAAKAAVLDEAQRYAAIRKARSLRHWSDPDGTFHLHARLTPDSGAEVLSAVKSRVLFVIEEAEQAGLGDARTAYEADALVALVTGDYRMATFQGNIGGRSHSSTLMVHVSLGALRRGSLEQGELCEIPGVGQVPLAVAEHVLGESFVKLVITDGVDVTTACSLGRTIPAAVETALEARDRTCVVPGCDIDLSLEIDHWQVPFARGGPSALWNLARLCRFHHQLKTYDGFTLAGGPGQWEWISPGSTPGGDAGGGSP